MDQHNTAAAVFNAQASKTQGRSLQLFLASLCTAVIIFILEIAIFLVFRQKWPQVYYPESLQAEDVYRISEAEIIARYGLDAFLFLRYLQTLLKIFIPLAVIILPVLIPVNLIHGIGARGGVYGLDRISWANVDRRHTARYWAHWCIAQVVVVWVCHVLWYEIQSYARIRHRRLLSVKRFENACGTTVLVTDIPRNLRNAEDLRLLYNVYPGGIRSLKINRDFRKLKRKIRERDQAVQQLESAETRLILQAQKANASSSCSQEKLKRLSEENRATRTLPACGILWFPPLPFVSEKVDMINFYRTRVAALNEEIRKEQADPVIFAETSSAIITFNRPLGAQLAAQSILHPQPHQMVATLVEDPSQVVWENVSMSWWERSTRSCLLGCISAWAIVACIVPVAFTGLLSQLGYTMTLFPWLSWLERVPSWVLSAVQGVLPPAMLATVTVLVPTVLQWLILAQGRNSFATAELVLQDYYFSFLFLQVFVVVSTSSSVATVLGSLEHEVSSVAALVAQNLPKAANYFFSYLILQALSVSSGSLLQVGRLVQFLSARVFHKTGRQLWEKIKKPEIRWGTFFPFYSNLAVITLIYTVVSPLILVLAILTFGSFLAVQRYNILHVASFNTDTGGLIYFKALNQLFVGLYIMELYLVGLFFLVRDKDGQVACIGQGVAMVVSTGLTAAFQVALSQAYKPLITTVPVMLSSGTSGNVSSDGKVEPRGHNPAWVYTVQKRVNRLHQLINRFVEEEVSPLKDFEEAEALVSRAEVREIEDSALIAEQPEVWLPRDEIGMSRYEIQQTQGFSSRINISDELFVLDKKGNIHYHGQGKYTNCAKLT